MLRMRIKMFSAQSACSYKDIKILDFFMLSLCKTIYSYAFIVTQAAAVSLLPETSSNKDDSNSLTAHNSINAGNSRNESNNRVANTVGTPTIAGMLAKEMKPATACREDNNNMDIGKGSRDASNIQQGRQQQQMTLDFTHCLVSDNAHLKYHGVKVFCFLSSLLLLLQATPAVFGSYTVISLLLANTVSPVRACLSHRGADPSPSFL
jgi:hypothetical protein